MKFTEGIWTVRPGVELFNAAQIWDSRWEGEEYKVYCAHREISHRGLTLNAPMITLSFRAPREGVVAVKVTHFEGGAGKNPEFALQEDGAKLAARETPEAVTLTSGSVSVVLQRRPFRMDVYESGKRVTGLGARHLGFALTPSGTHIRVKLDVGIGDKLYGLGERFTPFVKNGQTVETWNEDGGTGSELAYKSIPFYLTNRGYGVLVNSPGKVSFELQSEAVQSAQFSLPGETLEFMLIGGGDMKGVLKNYTALTGRAPLPPAWSFGLWLSTSFTTNYDEQTVLSFVDGMKERGIPMSVFHFDCFWMKGYEWCSFAFDPAVFPDPRGLLEKLHARGLKVCVWINPYVAQKSPLFREGKEAGYFLKRPNGDVWQWDMWQAGMALVDFTNPAACAWYKGKLKALMDLGVDSFKTDFGERIPADCVYHDGSDPVLMHNYYALAYNKTVFDLLKAERGVDDAVVFARSATVGGQCYPVHWGGDSSSNFPSMAESLRAGLSLALSGFAYWSHDISGFEDTAPPAVYMRWAQFGLLSSHSRLHGSSSYRVPWLFGEEAPGVVAQFARLKNRLMPYLFAAAVQTRETGLPLMRPMALEFPGDRACEDLDRQYMLGESLLIAPVFREDGVVEYYLPTGKWTHLLTGRTVMGGAWREERYGFDSLPLFVRENTLLPWGAVEDAPDYDYARGLTLRAYQVTAGCETKVYDTLGRLLLSATARMEGDMARVRVDGNHTGVALEAFGGGDTGHAFLKQGETETLL